MMEAGEEGGAETPAEQTEPTPAAEAVQIPDQDPAGGEPAEE